jgi:hypothetical protein
MEKLVRILDSTLCDGLNSAGLDISLDNKREIARRLAAARVDVIEAGDPSRSKADGALLEQIAQVTDHAIVAARSRAVLSEISTAYEAVAGARNPRIKIVIPTSPIYLHYTLRTNEEQACRQIQEAVAHARSLGAQVQVTAEDATRSDWSYLSRFFSLAISAGASVICVQDSVGRLTPKEFYDLVRHLRATVHGIHQVDLGVDCRHDFGMALANALSAVECGIQQVECTLGGVGFPLARVPLEAFVMALHSREDRYHATTSVLPAELHHLSEAVQSGKVNDSISSLRAGQKTAISILPQEAIDAEEGSFQDPTFAAEPPFTLDSFRIIITDDGLCSAEVELHRRDQERVAGSADATSQPEALHRAIGQAVGFRGLLVDHVVNHRGPTEKEVIVCVEDKGRVTTGHGKGRTVLQASATAYLNAVNKLVPYF